MKPEMILQSDFEDLLFEYRNKEYGAYALRREYSKRMYISVSVMLILALLFYLAQHWLVQNNNELHGAKTFMTNCPMEIEIKKVELIKPRLVQPPKAKAASVQYTVPVLVKEIVPPLAAMSQLEKDVQIGTHTEDGVPASSVSEPINALPETEGKGLGMEEHAETVFEKVEVMPEFPGGQAALIRYLSRKVRFNYEELEAGARKTILCRFIVDETGRVTMVSLLKSSGVEQFDVEAQRVVGTMPNWKPGSQNGKNVNVYFTLPFVIEVPEE